MWLLKCTDCFNFVFWLLTCLSILQNMRVFGMVVKNCYAD